MGSVIVGTGMAVPDLVVTNDDLARIMDTDDQWIRRRSGVVERRYTGPGEGAAELAARAVQAALVDAGVDAADVDLLVTATMTADHFAPGIVGLVQEGAGLGPVAGYDLRQQCSGFLYGLDLADAQLRAGRARTAVVVGAEAHAGYLPFGDSWAILRGDREGPPSEADWARATEARAWGVLFGDAAAAMVLCHDDDPGIGMLAATLHTDGSLFDLIHVPGLGFLHKPYVDASQLDAGLHLPHMNGKELFRNAVRLMPESVRHVLDATGHSVADLDLVIAHQANARIVEAAATALGVAPDRVPLSLVRYGNTTAATLPLTYHEQRLAGRVTSGDLVAFTAFGAGAHWGALLYREP